MRYVIIAILIYLIYIAVKVILKSISLKGKDRVEDGNKSKSKRSYDINQVQDAEFREVNKKD